jgi:hypothetical protein
MSILRSRGFGGSRNMASETNRGIRSAPIYGGASLGPVNLFRHHLEYTPVEETQLSSDPLLLPETPPSKATTAISLSPLEEANLCHALNRKVTRALKDLSLDGLNIPVIVGGAGQPRSGSPDQRSGPIV